MINTPSFTMGIEEEYLLVDPETRDLIQEAPPGMMEACQAELQEQVTPEFLQCQIEVGTRPFTSLRDVRDDLARLRRTVAAAARAHGVAMLAASTHPYAHWTTLRTTEKVRYSILARDMQAVARQLVISGMHVHVGLDHDDLRIDLMGQVSYVLPHLLALSTSSPFWQGQDTGLKSYRLAVWDQMPRSGLPEQLESFGDFARQVEVLVKTGVIEDSTKLWWDVRPSARFPTLEMRMTDICTRLDDAVCVAALYRCWLRMLYRLRMQNQRWRRYSNLLINENRWRAQRYGIDNGLIDFGVGEIVPFSDLLEEMLEMVRPDAEHFDCVAEVEHAHTIVKRGTSAHLQLDTYNKAKQGGADEHEALKAVVDTLIEATVADL